MARACLQTIDMCNDFVAAAAQHKKEQEGDEEEGEQQEGNKEEGERQGKGDNNGEDDDKGEEDKGDKREGSKEEGRGDEGVLLVNGRFGPSAMSSACAVLSDLSLRFPIETL